MATMTNNDIIDAIGQKTVIELSELIDAFKDKFNVEIAAPVAAAPAAAGGDAEAAVEEKTEFTVMLTSAGDKKIQVIKAVREITGLGLKEAKAVVDQAPKLVKEGLSAEEAETIKGQLEAAGATAKIA